MTVKIKISRKVNKIRRENLEDQSKMSNIQITGVPNQKENRENRNKSYKWFKNISRNSRTWSTSKESTTNVSSKMDEKRLIQRHYQDKEPKGFLQKKKKQVFWTKDKESEWHRISSQQHWKLEDNGALPWKHKGNFGKIYTYWDVE